MTCWHHSPTGAVPGYRYIQAGRCGYGNAVAWDRIVTGGVVAPDCVSVRRVWEDSGVGEKQAVGGTRHITNRDAIPQDLVAGDSYTAGA